MLCHVSNEYLMQGYLTQKDGDLLFKYNLGAIILLEEKA